MKILFVGGGTGGHFYPLIAIAEATRELAKKAGIRSVELYYMGPDIYDADALGNERITYLYCQAGKLRRYFSLHNVADFLLTIAGFFVALYKLYALYPDVVMSKAGYTSVPVVFAAFLLSIPIIIHESDSKPGRANRIAKYFATHIAISYPEAAEYFPRKKTALTGIPIRKKFFEPVSAEARKSLGLQGGRPLILVLGGSQGAERVNTLVLESLRDLIADYEIVHQTGAAHEAIVRESADAILTNNPHARFYHVAGFVPAEVMVALMSSATASVSRAGSTNIYEMALLGVPAILIPIPEDISHDQRGNAYAYARTGAAVVLEEKNMTPHLLVSEIKRIMRDAPARERMRRAAKEFARTDAAGVIAEKLILIGLEHERG